MPLRALILVSICVTACSRHAPPEPAPAEPSPAVRVLNYRDEVVRICEEARELVTRRAEATRCTSEAPARWETAVAQSFQWMDQSRRLIDPEEMEPTQPQTELRCEEVEVEPLSEADVAQLEGLSRLVQDAADMRRAWQEAPDDEVAMKQYLFSLEQLHGACLSLSAERL